MGIKTEKRHAGEFLLAEANGTLSREKLTVVSGAGVLEAGTLLGKITASGKYKAYANANSDGSETAAAILYAGIDATAADAVAVAIVRHAEVNAGSLIGLDAPARVDLTALQIAVR
jgi:hypothetical protein